VPPPEPPLPPEDPPEPPDEPPELPPLDPVELLPPLQATRETVKIINARFKRFFVIEFPLCVWPSDIESNNLFYLFWRNLFNKIKLT
jgi:hypothetical protein